jgi:hypothetical protein
MNEHRSQFCTLLLGGQRSGKTFYADGKVNEYPAAKKVLIVDPDGQEKTWAKYPIISLDKIAGMKGHKRIIFDSENPDFMKTLKDNFKNGLLILDDAKTYIRAGNSFKDFETLIIRRRASNIDIFLMYHGFSRIPLFVLTYATHCVLFRVDEDPDAAKDLSRYERDQWKKRITGVNALQSEKTRFPRKLYQLVKHIS